MSHVLDFASEAFVGVLGHEILSTIYFFADDAIVKNVFEWHGSLDRVVSPLSITRARYFSAQSEV